MAKLYVAMYRPTEGNYEHWALYLENKSEHKIYEVTGKYPHFKRNVVSGKPTSTSRHKRSILVSEINANEAPEVGKAASEVKVDNSAVHWTCQDFVIEILDKLVEECVIDGDEKSYKKAIKEVKEHYGPL